MPKYRLSLRYPLSSVKPVSSGITVYEDIVKMFTLECSNSFQAVYIVMSLEREAMALANRCEPGYTYDIVEIKPKTKES